MRVAAIDLGSNSFHMLVVEVLGPTTFETVLAEKMMIQVGKRALVSGRLDPETMERGLQCLDEFRRMALARRVERTIAVATSAIREAKNGEEFLRRAGARSGVSVRLISGREEARLIHLAVSRHVDLNKSRALIVDLGGGSVELTVGDANKIYYSSSQKLGFLRLHGRFVSGDPVTKREEKLLAAFMKHSLATPLSQIRKQHVDRVIATSGSATTLLRVAQQRRGERNETAHSSATVSRTEIRALLEDTVRLPAMECAKRFDLDPLRAEYFSIALLCLNSILEGIGAKNITVCPIALREGLVYDFLARTKPRAFVQKSTHDLRQQAVVDLATRCRYPAEHSHRVALLAGQVFKQTAYLHGLGDTEAKLLQYACILHDIGYHIGYSKHHKHGYYLVMSCDLHGFAHDERYVLAQLVRYHRRAVPKISHPEFAALPPPMRKTVRYLSAILRIADGLDQSHFSNVVEVKCRTGKKCLKFTLATSADSADIDLDLYMAKRHARYFEGLFDVETSFVADRLAATERKKRLRRS
jgi:exopolyphosphatase / guanosine-5'-triphosphate,3'-diphosphate pyrophosphatase